ncbi:MAG: pilus assembly protein N-terminal domain-containing protein [Schwartzia sp.]|nr:pilus assembly protein N-terminal domain-containing protein [Schwartzia sp. (in: firmicutes)]
MNRLKYSIAALGFVGTALFSPAAYAAENIDIDLNGSFLFEGGGPITNIAIANPAIADIVRPSGFDSQVLIVGVGSGSTTLYVWYENGAVESYTISVGIDDMGQARAIQRMIGLPWVRVQVVSIGDGSARRVLLRGKVKNQAEHDMALQVASLYTGDTKEKDSTDSGASSAASGISSGNDFEYDFDYRSNRIYPNVIDLLTIENPSQIRLEAQLIEIGSNDAKDIGLKFTGTDPQDGISFTAIGQFYGGESVPNVEGRTTNHDSGFWLWDHFSKINASLNLLIQQGKAKVLSRPSVSTMSGAKAKIFIGGQLPVPVDHQDGGQTIEWKDYGIRLHIRPTVDEDGMITAEVHAGVSRLDYSNSVVTSSTSVPAITAREAHSIVHLNDGSTMVVGGLLNSEDVKTVSKVPLLSAIPIIGEFFKHTESSTERRELIILITPIIVNENTPARMSEKMQDYYNKGREEEKARKDVDLNADRKAEEEERIRKEQEAEREAIAAEWRARGNSTPRVHPGNAWNRIYYPEDDGAAAEAAEAANTPGSEASQETAGAQQSANQTGNRKVEKTPEQLDEEARVREAREAAVAAWNEREDSTPRVRPGNAWARVQSSPDEGKGSGAQ